jgi:S-layer domain
MRKYVPILFVLLIISSGLSQLSTEVTVDLKETEPTPLQTSEYADIWLNIYNNGSTPAQDMEVTFKENYPFEVDPGDKTSWNIRELVPGDVYQIHLDARIDSNAVQGQNQLEFSIEQQESTFTEKVPVEIRSDRNSVSVEEIGQPGPVSPGASRPLGFRIENLADTSLKNFRVSLDLGGDLPVASSGTSTRNLETLGPEEVTSLNYSIRVDESAEPGVFKIPVDVTFENKAGTEFEQSTTTGLVVGGAPVLDPGLSLDDPLVPGSTREVTLRLVNKGSGPADYVTLGLEESDSYDLIGSKTVYIGNMDPDDFQTASFKVHLSENASSLEMPLELSYTADGTDFESSETVSRDLVTRGQLERYGLRSTGSPLPVAVLVIILAGTGFFVWKRR